MKFPDNWDAKRIFDSIPYAMSIFRMDHTVIYQNPLSVKLLGKVKYCYEKFPNTRNNWGTTSCDNCPLQKPFYAKRKVVHLLKLIINNQQQDTKVDYIPILDDDGNVHQFMQITTPLVSANSLRFRLLAKPDQLQSDLKFLMVRFGKIGGEKVAGDSLFDWEMGDDTIFITSLAAYWILALGQGEAMNEGLYGPLPLIKFTEYSSMAYAVILKSDNADYRFKGKEYSILLILFKKYLQTIFEEREMIAKFLHKKFLNVRKVESIDDSFISELKSSLLSLLLYS